MKVYTGNSWRNEPTHTQKHEKNVIIPHRKLYFNLGEFKLFISFHNKTLQI